MPRYHIWHDDGREIEVEADNYNLGFDEAMEQLSETDISKIALEQVSDEPEVFAEDEEVERLLSDIRQRCEDYVMTEAEAKALSDTTRKPRATIPIKSLPTRPRV